jgi:hypothetical protein
LPSSGVYLENGRSIKARKLADVLDAFNCVSDTAADMDDEIWVQAARIAGVVYPSDEAKKLVVTFLQEREDIRRRVREMVS